jgi:hypothetical protein
MVLGGHPRDLHDPFPTANPTDSQKHERFRTPSFDTVTRYTTLITQLTRGDDSEPGTEAGRL